MPKLYIGTASTKVSAACTCNQRIVQRDAGRLRLAAWLVG